MTVSNVKWVACSDKPAKNYYLCLCFCALQLVDLVLHPAPATVASPLLLSSVFFQTRNVLSETVRITICYLASTNFVANFSD